SPGLAGPLRVLRRGDLASLGQVGHCPPQEADGLRLGERRDLDAVSEHVAWPLRLPRGNDDVSVATAGRYVFLEVKRIGGVIEYKQPTRPRVRLQRFQCGGYSPVARAIRGGLPELQPLTQLHQRIPYPVGVLCPDPPDNF